MRNSNALEEEVLVSYYHTVLYFDYKLGSAWMVRHRIENVKYVAKKVALDGMGSKEQSGCMMEAGLLKNLNHPNIVEYKESFLGKNSLTIIMEYCEGKFRKNS